MRHERQTANAQAIAMFLSEHPKVQQLRYPGLSSDPAHETAKRQMLSFGCVISFQLSSQAAAEQWLAAGGLIYEATSFGGLHTMAERRARWKGESAPENLIRLSVGCEPLADLIDQLASNLDQIE